jgi:hypothetical protein
VVLPSGELEMRMVEIGLKDYVNAEVISGLQRGDVVSLGESTTSSSSSQNTTNSTNSTEQRFPGGDFPPMFPGG